MIKALSSQTYLNTFKLDKVKPWGNLGSKFQFLTPTINEWRLDTCHLCEPMSITSAAC